MLKVHIEFPGLELFISKMVSADTNIANNAKPEVTKVKPSISEKNWVDGMSDNLENENLFMCAHIMLNNKDPIMRLNFESFVIVFL
jgi:hypothetical protein